jgi:hypothetical protein
MKVRHMKARQKRATAEPSRNEAPRPYQDPKWATTLVLGTVAVATLAITRSVTDVPVVLGVLGSLLLALGVTTGPPTP